MAVVVVVVLVVQAVAVFFSIALFDQVLIVPGTNCIVMQSSKLA